MAGFSFGFTEDSFLQLNSQNHLRSAAEDLLGHHYNISDTLRVLQKYVKIEESY